MPMIVRPNQWDSRERRLEDISSSLVRTIQKTHPEDFVGNATLANLDLRVAVLRAEQELAEPRGSDLGGRVRSPLIRWWRDLRSSDD